MEKTECRWGKDETGRVNGFWVGLCFFAMPRSDAGVRAVVSPTSAVNGTDGGTWDPTLVCWERFCYGTPGARFSVRRAEAGNPILWGHSMASGDTKLAERFPGGQWRMSLCLPVKDWELIARVCDAADEFEREVIIAARAGFTPIW